METLADRVRTARKQVDDFKNHLTGEANLAVEVGMVDLSQISKMEDFAVLLSTNFERIAAILFHRRHDLTNETIQLASWAHGTEEVIAKRLEALNKKSVGSGFEDLGKLWVEETLEWALKLLHTDLPAWGYDSEITDETKRN